MSTWTRQQILPLPPNFLEDVEEIEMDIQTGIIVPSRFEKLLNLYLEAIAFYDAKEDQKKVDFYTKKMMNLKTNPNIQQELEKAYQAEEKKRLISENVSPEEKKRIKQEILENNKNKKHTSFTANLIEAAQASADKNDAILAADFISQFDELAALVKERSLKREKLSKSTNKPRRNSQGDSNKKVELLAVPSHPTLEIPDDLEKPENEDLLPKSARSTNKKNFFNRIKTGSKKKSIIKKSTNSEEGHVNISEFNPTGQNPILDHEIQEEIRKAELELQAEIEEAEKEAKELEEQLQRELEEEESKITKNEFISITVAPVDLDDNTITISPPRKKGKTGSLLSRLKSKSKSKSKTELDDTQNVEE